MRKALLTPCCTQNCLQSWNDHSTRPVLRIEQEEIVAHLERELELNALEESDDLPMATMASASSKNSNLLSNGINTNKEAQCSCCKATGHYYKSCSTLKKKKEMEEKDGKKPQRPTYPPCDTCGKMKYPTEICWQGAGAHLRPKRTQALERDANSSNSEKKLERANYSETASSSQINSKNSDSKN